MSFTVTPARLAVAALACSAAFAARAACPVYHVEAYDPDAFNDSLVAISSNGIVAGQATLATTLPGESDAVTFADGRYHVIDPNGDYQGATAYGVNSAGTTVGLAWPNPNGEVVTWDAAGTMTVLTGYAKDARGINDAGQVVGTSQSNQATIWQANGKPKLLGTLGGTSSMGYAINAKGWVTGWGALPGNTTSHPFLYKNGTMTDLGTLGLRGTGYAINDKGHVAGIADFGPTMASQHPVWWDGTAWHDLVGLGGKGAGATGINNHDVIVGWSALKNKTTAAAFIYKKGKLYQLDKCLDPTTAPGWQLASANAINDDGVIVGRGYIGGTQHGFVATPVPQ